MAQKVFIKTYGCSLNRYNSGLINHCLSANDFVVLEQPFGSDKYIFRDEQEFNWLKQADFILLNTCTLSDYAEREIVAKSIEQLKEINSQAQIAILGCSLKNKNSCLNQIDNILKFEELSDLFTYFKIKNFKFATKLPQTETAIILLKENCNNLCTYCSCAAKNKQNSSLGWAAIVRQLKRAKLYGYKKIEFGGPCYGDWQDINNAKYKFKDILALASRNFEIINLELHPQDLSAELIEVIRNNQPRIKEISLPIQHDNDRILQLMNRGYDKKYLETLLVKLNQLAGLEITTDLIVGFPSETEDEWREVIDFIKAQRLKRIDVYYFSSRNGTPAAKLGSQVSELVKVERAKKLLESLDNQTIINITTQ